MNLFVWIIRSMVLLLLLIIYVQNYLFTNDLKKSFMIFSFRGKKYNLVLKHKILPIALLEVVSSLNGEPDYYHFKKGIKLQNKVALVTGGGKGIGFHITLRLLSEGCKVIITGRNEELLKKTIKYLNTQNLASLVWDISDKNINSHYDEAEKLFGKIDILVNNAGVTSDTSLRPSFEEMSIDHYHYVHDINTIATCKMCKEFAKRFHNGTVLNIISNTGVLPALDAYFTSKWALYSFTCTIGKVFFDYGYNVTVNGLCPGPIKTDMTVSPNTTLYRKEIPNHRIGLPQEVAELAFVQILAGLNGQNGEITICDGGQVYRL